MVDARRYAPAITVVALLSLPLAQPASGQAAPSGWTPFVGCWEPLDAGGEAGLLCLRPEGQGIEMFQVLDGEVTSTEHVVADGTRRAVSAEGCTGFEAAAFSEDRHRIFTSSEFECGGETRRGSGIMSFIAPTQWIDVRALDVSGEPVAWVQRYMLADRETLAEHGVDDPASFDRALVRAARLRASEDIEVEDVEEAVGRIDTRAVEVWVATQETRFDLSGSDLVRLADTGMPESVIDVMVAVSYPDRFVVSPEGVETATERERDQGYRTGYRRGFRTYLWDPYYRPLRFGYYSYYSPFGYYGYGPGSYYGSYYGGYYGYRPAPIVVQPRTRSTGQIIPGRGYTRGSASDGTGSRSARPRSSGGSGASSRSSGGGTGPAASSGGSSRSGSSGSSGSSGGTRRTARRR